MNKKVIQFNPKAQRTAKAYIDAVNEHDAQTIADLFAMDGKLIHPSGIFNRDDIRQLNMESVKHHHVVNKIKQGNTCVLEFEVFDKDTPDQIQHTVDIIDVNEEGKITRLAIYTKD